MQSWNWSARKAKQKDRTMTFTKLDENNNGVSEFSYGNAKGVIVSRGGDKHVIIRLGNAEINAFCEDADDILNVFAELLIQDTRWAYDSMDDDIDKEPF